MSAFAPPLPGDSNTTGAGPSTSQQDPASSAPSSSGASPFGGGATAILQAVKQIESGYQMLAQQLPSLAPLAADGITKLRSALPQALGSGQGQPGPSGPPTGGPPQGGPGGASGGQGMAPPPQPQGQ